MNCSLVALLSCAAAAVASADMVSATYTIPFNTYSFGLQSGSNTATGGAVVINGLRTGDINDTHGSDIANVFSTFCVEVGESVQVGVAPLGSGGPTTYIHNVSSLLGSTTITGGFSGPVTFDAVRTSNMRRLFGNFYPGTVQSNPIYSAAFQLAVWEISFDNDLNISTGSGFTVTSGDASAQTLAQNFLNTIALDTSYGTDLYLISFDGTQDLITIVPTPGSVALLGLGGLIAGRRRRRN